MNEKRAGYFNLLKFRGIPVLIHWSLPAGGMLISAYVGFNPTEAVYFSLAYLSLIAIHEFAHLGAARFTGLNVFSVHISGIGGECRVEIPRTITEGFIVYSAGLFAQFAVFALSMLYVEVVGVPNSVFGQCLVKTFIFVNLVMFVSNIIPYASSAGLPSDGHVLWKLFLYKFTNSAHPLPSPNASRLFPEGTSLLLIKSLVPKEFRTGIEILNDDKTPMEFVVNTLMRHLHIERDDAIKRMLSIHSNGGILIALPTMESAEHTAHCIVSEAREHGHPLVRRAIDAEQAATSDNSTTARRA